MPTKAETKRPVTSPLAIRLTAYLGTRQEDLVDQSIEIAKSNGYAPFTTTIRAAWVEAVLSVTEAVGTYISLDGGLSGPEATTDYAKDPRFAQMRRIARIHRSQGITLQMYIGLFKHFRNIYVAALDGFDGCPDLNALRARMLDCFDEAELSITADWTESGDNQRLRELQERTRTLTLDKDRYFAVFESLRNPAFLLDRQKALVNANQAAAELFLGDVQAGDIIYLRSMRRRKLTLQQALDRVLAVTPEADAAIWLDTLAGQRCFDIRMRALHDAVENTALGHVLILNDVTAHQNAVQKAQQAERQMSRFLATMSHEIRTPLHSVLGATDLLRNSDVDTHANYLDVIESAGQSLLQTLNNVLDYSKLENSPPVPRPVMTDLRAAIEAFQRVAAIRTTEQKPPVRAVVAPDVPRRVGIDWAMTRQVLTNLVSNAIRFDDGCGVHIDVSALSTDFLRFVVRDHGPGIGDADAAALTQPFNQIEARDTGCGGAGLGLAISSYLVRAMGGRIGYENVDDGSRVWFELPHSAIASAHDECPDDRGPSVSRGNTGCRCLLIDDDHAGSMVTARQLELLGFSVDQAGTVTQAMKRAAAADYDVFVVDYLLPDGDGPTLVKSLSALHPHARAVAFTANVEAVKDSDQANRLFDAVLAKPADLAALGDALRWVGGGSKTVRTISAVAPVSELTEETAQAMAKAFADQWDAFCDEFLTGGPVPELTALGHAAHRLAGSAALLGLGEVETPLRSLERKCDSGAPWSEIEPVLASLEVDLETLTSWPAIEPRIVS